MLLVIDIGNTNTVLGVYSPARGDDADAWQFRDLVANWRVTSNKGNTVDEYANAFRAHYLLGQVLEQLGDRQGAIGEYRFSLALASGYHPAQDALRRLGA